MATQMKAPITAVSRPNGSTGAFVSKLKTPAAAYSRKMSPATLLPSISLPMVGLLPL